MDKESIKKIIEDYDFACIVADRYKNITTSSLCELYDELGFNCYNLYDGKDGLSMFDMEIDNLIITYNKESKGISKAIQIWTNRDAWEDTTIDNLREMLGDGENDIWRWRY